jgi:hypothetical protein
LEEILKKIQNNKDALSTAVRWIASPSHKRTISPYSTINSSTINSTVNSLHDFSDSNQKLVFQGIFNSERRSWGTEKDSTEFDGIISDNEGGFFIRNLGFPLRVLLQDRKVSIKGRRADSMPIPRLFKQDQHYNSVNFETKYKSSLVVDNWNEVEELPLTGVVNRVWAAKGRSKKVFLELKVSEAVKKEIEFASNSGISMSDLEKIQGTAISVFPNDMYYPLIHNPMDVFVDGVPWGYSIGSEVAPSTPFWQDFIQTNGAVQSVVGLASKYFDYSRHRGRYDTPGFQLLELTLDSGAKLGLILMVPSKEDPPAIAFSALVGKKIVARGRGLKLRGRPQLFIESLQDIRVENDKGELVPWLDAILQEFTIRFQSYEMVTRMGTIARFEAENQDGTRLFELVLENGGKVNISLHESILQTSSDDLLAKFVGKKVTAIGMKLSGKQMSRTNSEFMIMNINDLRLIDSESKNPTGAVSEKF